MKKTNYLPNNESKNTSDKKRQVKKTLDEKRKHKIVRRMRQEKK